MKVQKRNGTKENVSFDKIQNRILSLCIDPKLTPLNIDPTIVAQKVCSEIYDGVTTEELDLLSSEISIALYSKDKQSIKLFCIETNIFFISLDILLSKSIWFKILWDSINEVNFL